jgi:hypothetical protein
MSNFYNPTSVSTVPRKNKYVTSEDISYPWSVKEYTTNMSFVDKADILKSLYETGIV